MEGAARKRWSTFERIMLCAAISAGAIIIFAAGLSVAVLWGYIDLK